MKLTKKLIALVIVCIMALSITGCHKQNEIAVTVNGYEFTSGYYMCALVNAYSEGQSTVYEAKEDKTDINYFKEKIDGKEFSVWVKDRAIDLLEEIGTYKKLCDDNKVKIDDEVKANAENNAYYMWSMYGYSALFEPNGVSYETYKKFTLDSYYQTLYFEHLYGEKGEKEIASADVEKKLYETFIIADLIDVTFSSDEKDTEKNETKAKLEGYVKDLNSKKKTFEEVYKLHNNITDEEDKKEEDDKEEAETLKPLDEYAQILGAKDSGYDHDYFDDINKMATNEVKLITKKDNAGYLLVVKKDIKADPYYRDSLDMTVRHLLKDADFEKDMEKLFKEAKADINSYAVDRFKVKNIKEPSYS